GDLYGRCAPADRLRPARSAVPATRPSGLVEELRAELAADSPGQPALARPALREDHRKFGRNFGIFGDDLHAAIRHVRNHAVARQPTGRELYFCKASARPTFAAATIRIHIDP